MAAWVHRRFLAFTAVLAFAASSLPQTKPATESFDSVAQRAAAARDADRLDEAVSLYKKALAMRPKWAEGWWSLGTLEYDRNNYRSAAGAFRQLLPLAPKDGTAYAMLGLSEFELGQDDAALKHLETAKSLEISTNPQLRDWSCFITMESFFCARVSIEPRKRPLARCAETRYRMMT